MRKDWWDKEFQWLFTLGESTTAGGWTSCRERSWPAQLARMINEFQRFPTQLVNMGIGANVISQKSAGYDASSKPCLSERLEKHVLSHTANGLPVVPDLLIISYGLNDARSGTPIATFREEMSRIIARVRERIQPLVVLPGPSYMIDFQLGGKDWNHANVELMQRYNEAIAELAAREDALFVDLLAAYGGADWLVHFDGCHSNDLGHRLIANGVFEVLASNCSGLSLETKALEKYISPWRDESTLQQ